MEVGLANHNQFYWYTYRAILFLWLLEEHTKDSKYSTFSPKYLRTFGPSRFNPLVYVQVGRYLQVLEAT